MTIAEMHIALKLELDKTTALELPAFEPEEFEKILEENITNYYQQVEDEIVGADIVKDRGGEIITVNLSEGYSTTNIINKIRS